ncbi:uncharacterized protein B0H18DRAFT_869033 [Fomitopsis serialis]|uniref:uncharacterized protein n=1 Tax=Fomitopsis serialis TaxID=139415 RepID=UPI002008E5F5|nr:uncharacterized protein B0H18DRAFT_869033 [Neoantrodia serialis]KAH9935680.1 hypothetical protein B0H18DRAFT_869033 [Neoantrodia serialis]
MSFPAVLRNPGIADRFAHLHRSDSSHLRGSSAAPAAPKKNKRDEKEGKRWVRRKENARFAGNAHIVLPSKRDYALVAPHNPSTFPQPLPNYLPRNNAIPPAVLPGREPASANAGRFSMSLKGMRRELRKSGPRTEQLVRELEDEILAWLDGGVMLEPDAAAEISLPGRPVDSGDTVKEVSRTPLQLVWWIEDNSWTRYVVHCCARYHEVVSFSKDNSGQRLTYLLRPNVTRPTHGLSTGLDTPPATDLESSVHSDFDAGSASDAFSDRRSDSGLDSDVELVACPAPRALSAIAESAPGSPARAPAPLEPLSEDEWSVIGDDADAEDSEVEAARVGSLALRDAEASPRMRQASFRSHVWERQRRSASSPSRSPARRPARMYRVEPPRSALPSRRSFHEYLFS